MNPALVQPSGGLDLARRPRSARGAASAARSERPEPPSGADQHKRDPGGRKGDRCRAGATRCVRRERSHRGRRAGERPEQRAREPPRARRTAPRGGRSVARISTGDSAASARPPSRRPEQHEADHLDEAQHRERRRRCKRGQRERRGQPAPTPPVQRHVHQRLQGEPLGDEPVERRQPGDRHCADQERAAGPRHPPQQTAQPVELERADRALERTRAQEQQRLEHRVVQRVQQRRRQGERRQRVGARARSNRHAPSPSTMMPMFSIECNARSRFRSCWNSA